MTEIEIVQEKPLLVAGMRKRGHYREIAVMLPALFEYAFSREARIAGPPLFLCHERGIEEAMRADQEGSADIEVCIPIAERIAEGGEVRCYELPGGRMVRVAHKGPYEECGPTYERLFAWIKEQNLTMCGPIREAYLNDPNEVSPDEIMTVICAPVR